MFKQPDGKAEKLQRHVPQQVAGGKVTKESSVEDKAKLAQDTILLKVAKEGRGGDTVLGHLSIGDTVVPREMITPDVLGKLHKILGKEFGRYVVGNKANSINPKTGLREFDGDNSFTAAAPTAAADSPTDGGEDSFTVAASTADNTPAPDSTTSAAASAQVGIPNNVYQELMANWGANKTQDVLNGLNSAYADHPDQFHLDSTTGLMTPNTATFQNQVNYTAGHYTGGKSFLSDVEQGISGLAPIMPILSAATLAAGPLIGAIGEGAASIGDAAISAGAASTDAFGVTTGLSDLTSQLGDLAGFTDGLAGTGELGGSLIDPTTAYDGLSSSSLEDGIDAGTADAAASEAPAGLTKGQIIAGVKQLVGTANSILNPDTTGTGAFTSTLSSVNATTDNPASLTSAMTNPATVSGTAAGFESNSTQADVGSLSDYIGNPSSSASVSNSYVDALKKKNLLGV